jgi:methionyl aminopeptidase
MSRVMSSTLLAPKANDPCWCGSGRKFKRCHKASTDHIRPGQVSPTRPVPPEIPRPPYAESGVAVRRAEPHVRTPEVIERMRRAGRAAGEILQTVGAAVAPGVTTDELDALCHEECIRRGGYPSPLNYGAFPKSLCTSVNEVICHGIPDDRALIDGDIVNLDVTIFLDGVHGDTNATFPVGTIDQASADLIRVTRECLDLGIAAVKPGRQIREIGRAIQAHAEGHDDDPRATTVIEPGMTFTIEPMITMGAFQHELWPDKWTAVTVDRRRTAQFEHTLLVTDDGVEILTLVD